MLEIKVTKTEDRSLGEDSEDPEDREVTTREERRRLAERLNVRIVLVDPEIDW